MPIERPAPTSSERGQNWSAGQALYGLLAAVVRSQPRDMSLTSLSTLATLDLNGPRRITDLACSEGVLQPSMTALVSGLERSGLVERRSDPGDGRVALVALTPSGSDYLTARRQAGAAAFERLIDQLPPDESQALVASITALHHLHDLEDELRAAAVGSASGPWAGAPTPS